MKTKVRLKKKILKILGQKVRFYRNKLQLSQEALAFDIGVDRTYIGAIEQGMRSPSIYCLFVMANRLNINLKDLFDFNLDD